LKSFQDKSVDWNMSEASSPKGGTVLLVEDDEQVRRFVRSLLSGDGYQILEAATGTDALQLAETHSGDIDLLLSDMLLPELSGYDLAQRLQPLFPRMKVLFMTGYVEGDIVTRGVGELGASFLDKPFQPVVLLNRVRQMVEASKAAAI
jgi:CheY-like chemotaxis protein